MANTFELIASTGAPSASVASLSFTSIPATFTDLVVLMSIRSTSTNNYGSVLFNSSSTGYTRRILYGDGSSVFSTTPTGYESLSINPSNATASTFANYQMYIPNYAGSNNKSFSVDAVGENNGTTAQAIFHAGVWANSAAITSLTITSGVGNIEQYSTAYLYGVKNA
jgi:hypothetical protein